MKPTQTCINIVADGEIYTAMTHLLISTIRACHGADDRIRIIVGVPLDRDHGLSLSSSWPERLELIRLPVSPVIDDRNGNQYRHFHKISLFDMSAERFPDCNQLLLDSDLVLLRPLPLRYLSQHLLAAMPVHYCGWGGDWPTLYHSLGLPLKALTLSSSGYESGPAYYNAGFVWANHNVARKLRWSDMALRIYEQHSGNCSMQLFPWLDQLALPVAAAHLQRRIYELPDCLNMLIDKFLVQATANELLPGSNFMPSKPYVVHHHRNIKAVNEVITRYMPQLLANEDANAVLANLLRLTREQHISQNRVKYRDA